jgi:hypothetical protein
MTRARALKQIVRTRAAKTGERYTTARRHVLKDLAHPSTTPRAATASPTAGPPATTPKAQGRPPAGGGTKGSVSDATARARTGHGLDYWFAVLDRFGGVEKGHTASARHLSADHGVPGWYAQGITVAFERARGLRTLHQRMSGDYEVSVTKAVAAGTETVVRAFADPKRRAKWLPRADSELSAALVAALEATAAKGFVVRPDRQGRFRYKWNDTTVQFNLLPKGEDRTSVVVTHLKLPDVGAVEKRRAQWRSALAALASTLGD